MEASPKRRWAETRVAPSPVFLKSRQLSLAKKNPRWSAVLWLAELNSNTCKHRQVEVSGSGDKDQEGRVAPPTTNLHQLLQRAVTSGGPGHGECGRDTERRQKHVG